MIPARQRLGFAPRFLGVFWLLALVLLPAFSADEPPVTERPDTAGTFPLVLVLEAAEFAGSASGTRLADTWRPDWPPELPPDAFRPLSNDVSQITLEGEGFSLALRFDAGGRIEEFPFMLHFPPEPEVPAVDSTDGDAPPETGAIPLHAGIAQVSLRYGEDFVIREMTLTFQGEDAASRPGQRETEEAPDREALPSEETEASGNEAWKLEFLEYKDSFPALVRASRGEAWYFIALSRGGNRITETWYDAEGKALVSYTASLVEIGGEQKIRTLRDHSNQDSPDTEFFYDSRGFLTEISRPDSLYRVLYYREDLPGFWERLPAADKGTEGTVKVFSFQWDEKGFLLRISGGAAAPENTEDAGDDFVDFRYEYTLDERGNWIERREIRMLRNFGLLVPAPGTTFKRILEYRTSE